MSAPDEQMGVAVAAVWLLLAGGIVGLAGLVYVLYRFIRWII